MAKDAPLYRVLETSYIGHQIVEPGSEVEYDGEPGQALEPLNGAAKENARIAEKRREARTTAQRLTPERIAQILAKASEPELDAVIESKGQGRVMDPGPDRVNESPFTPAQNSSQLTTGTPPLEAQKEVKLDPRDKGDPAKVQGSKAQRAAETGTEKLQREAAEAQAKADEGKDLA